MENTIPVNIPGGKKSILDGAGSIKDVVSEETVQKSQDRLAEYETEVAVGAKPEMKAVDLVEFYRNMRTKPLLRDYPKVGRNDPCPCGSGKKYKNCCLESGKYEGLHQKESKRKKAA